MAGGTDVAPFLFLTGSHHLMGNQVAGIVESIDIRYPVGKVFTVATDAARWSTWHTAIAEAEQASAGPVESRHGLQGTIRLMGRSSHGRQQPRNTMRSGSLERDRFGFGVFIEQHNTYTPITDGTNGTMVYDTKSSGCRRVSSPKNVHALRNEMERSAGQIEAYPCRVAGRGREVQENRIKANLSQWDQVSITQITIWLIIPR